MGVLQRDCQEETVPAIGPFDRLTHRPGSGWLSEGRRPVRGVP